MVDIKTNQNNMNHHPTNLKTQTTTDDCPDFVSVTNDH
jgi:hypothetical protein